ncbi:MAG: NAD(P)-dependent oxidoreductase [Magnetococcales bacterium]|nr:NAD(P)-dependent oxidoreductase [Magnetococcales bacterium]
MRIALTGAKGWVGQRLFAYLERQHEVVALVGDVRRADTFVVAPGFDVLLHLASPLPWDFKERFSESVEVSLTGMYLALEACVRYGASLVFASTSGVYTRGLLGAVGEHDDLIRPPELYGQSKWLAEQICRLYHQSRSIPVRILRLFNLYGPGQTERLLIGYLLRQVCQKGVIELHHPHDRRDFIHVHDVVRAFAASATRPFSGLQTINIGSSQAWSVLDVVRIAERMVAYPLDVRLPEQGAMSHESVYADITAARHLLDWNPEITLAAGLADCLGVANPEVLSETAKLV